MDENITLQVKTKNMHSELELMNERLLEGAGGFDRIYQENASYVYNACLGILGDSEDSRDAMQETFIQLYKSLSKMRGGCTYRTWLYRVAVNKCMDILRRRRKCMQTDSLDWFRDECASIGDGLLEEQVRQSILRLKPEFRAVLVLYYFQQLSYAEIAESLGCSLVQVRTRLHRARKAFRLVFDNGGDDIEM